jgi:Protein of unknown function (DUF3306)
VSEDLQKRLSRWSQRKLAAVRGAPAEDSDAKLADAPTAAPADAALGEEVAPELPPVDELTVDSDYTVFLRKNVPAALRNAALRKLWSSDPVFANRDGLCDYDEDFNALLTPVTPAQTSYQVGSGYLDKVEEVAAKLESAKDETGERRIESSAAKTGAKRGEIDEAGLSKNDAAGDDSEAATSQPHPKSTE